MMTKIKSLLKIPRRKLWKKTLKVSLQKQPFRGVLKKKCSENMQQIYRTSISKYDFNKVALQRYKTLLKSHFGMGVLLQICYIFSEHLFLGAPLDGCFCLYFLLMNYFPKTLKTEEVANEKSNMQEEETWKFFQQNKKSFFSLVFFIEIRVAHLKKLRMNESETFPSS